MCDVVSSKNRKIVKELPLKVKETDIYSMPVCLNWSYLENFLTINFRKKKSLDHFSVYNRPTQLAIESLIKKFQRTFSLKDERNLACYRASVSVSIAKQPKGFSVFRNFEPTIYKIQLIQQLQLTDHRQTNNFLN